MVDRPAVMRAGAGLAAIGLAKTDATARPQGTDR